MKLGDWILVGVIAALFVAAVVFLIRQKKRGGCIGCSACASVKKKGSRTGCTACTRCTECTGCCDTCPSHAACGEKPSADGDAHTEIPAQKSEDEPQKDRPADSHEISPEQSPEELANE
ncbi:MAG: hypothetical protein ACI3XE_01570 [Eubacteriales bacterium]